MAASGWNYLVEFDGTAKALLHKVQQQAFVAGKYQIPIVESEFLDEIEFFDVGDVEREDIVEHYGLQPLLAQANKIGLNNIVPWCIERMHENRVKTIDELRAMQCLSSSGTHSPLDISGVSEVPADFRLFPLTRQQIARTFGVDRVTLDHVSSMDMYVARAIPDAYAPWQAVFVPVYENVSLTHAYVEGASGD
ncbi:hypothetical protein [Aeoliella sp.]|uniref:hypothetical protein n=1 Tax=Aeoliella sp. TaxID=2795800 RepID=UPI003CCB93CE